MIKIARHQQIRVDRVVVNPEQPRRIFDKTELRELAESIREHGVIEPIIVEKRGGGLYMLHDGERRLRAAKLVDLIKIPAMVSPPLNGTGPRERLERAMVANLQRVEMHPIEEGLGYRRLMVEFDYDIKDVVKRTGKHSTRIHYCLDLLGLDAPIRQLMLERKLPCESRAVNALLSVANSKERVKLAQALADRNATAKMIIHSCNRFNAARNGLRTRSKGSPAMHMVKTNRPEWDALYQLGKIPPWQIVTNAVMATCDTCPLRSMASDATCRDCALVIGLKRMMEAAHVQ